MTASCCLFNSQGNHRLARYEIQIQSTFPVIIPPESCHSSLCENRLYSFWVSVGQISFELLFKVLLMQVLSCKELIYRIFFPD